jgi:hypothetical protein
MEVQVHERKPGDTKVKPLVLFCAAPPSTYTDPSTYDNTDLSDIAFPSGNMIPIVSEAKYLGSMMSRDCTDDTDVDARIKAASRAFSALSKCVFKSRNISLPGCRVLVYAPKRGAVAARQRSPTDVCGPRVIIFTFACTCICTCTLTTVISRNNPNQPTSKHTYHNRE